MLIADKAFDADQRVLEPLAEAGKTAVIPPRKTRTTPRAFDKDLYEARHLIENFFAKLKQFRAIATRYDKTARCFLAGIHLAAALIWLNCGHAIERSTTLGLSKRDHCPASVGLFFAQSAGTDLTAIVLIGTGEPMELR